eukprot:476084-Prymnesium_polylepis.1
MARPRRRLRWAAPAGSANRIIPTRQIIPYPTKTSGRTTRTQKEGTSDTNHAVNIRTLSTGPTW